MSWQERVEKRLEAARKQEEKLAQLEKSRYYVQHLMYEAEEVVRSAATRLNRAGLPASMSKAVQKAFAAVNDAVLVVESVDLRGKHPEAGRAALKNVIVDDPEPVAPPVKKTAGPVPPKAKASVTKTPVKARQPKANPAVAEKSKALVKKAPAKPAKAVPAKKAAPATKPPAKAAKPVKKTAQQRQLSLLDNAPMTPQPKATRGGKKKALVRAA